MNIGRILQVCMAKNACKKHWPEYQPKCAPRKSAAEIAEERRKAEIETLYTQGLLATVYKLFLSLETTIGAIP